MTTLVTIVEVTKLSATIRIEINSTKQCIKEIPKVYRDTMSDEKYHTTK